MKDPSLRFSHPDVFISATFQLTSRDDGLPDQVSAASLAAMAELVGISHFRGDGVQVSLLSRKIPQSQLVSGIP
jgi:hypothetical protein